MVGGNRRLGRSVPVEAVVGRSAWSRASVHYTGEFWFPADLGDFWRLIEDFDRYEDWWPWLEAFSTETVGLVAGNVLQGTVVPPIPYRLHLQVRLHSCRRLAWTLATIEGDLRGDAAMYFDEVDGGTRVRAEWTLHMASAPLRVAVTVARPVVRWGHDRVVEMAVGGITRRLAAAPRTGSAAADRPR